MHLLWQTCYVTNDTVPGVLRKASCDKLGRRPDGDSREGFVDVGQVARDGGEDQLPRIAGNGRYMPNLRAGRRDEPRERYQLGMPAQSDAGVRPYEAKAHPVWGKA